MGKALLYLLAGLFTSHAFASCPEFLDHEFRKLHSSESVNLCQSYGGRPMLVINTASHCGFTDQFEGLEALHQQYKDKGLVVVGFASNDFKQEADSEAEAAEVCYVNYGVSFTMIAPSHVKGEQANPVFAELARQTKAPSWNFNKYLVDGSGTVVEKYGSMTGPDSKKLNKAIEALLAN